MTARLSIRRFRPRIKWMMLTLALIALFVTAGNWQRVRFESKAELRAQYDTLAQQAPAPLPDLGPNADWSSQRFRRVTLRGEYDLSHQILIDNAIRNGRAGYEVVTPMKLDDGRVVLIDRGWIAVGASRAVLPDALPPAGMVTVSGRIDIPPARYLEFGSTGPEGPLWQNLDPARFAQSTKLAVPPIVIEATSTPDRDDGLLRQWREPDFGIEMHRVYMLQWYALAVLAFVLWLTLEWRGAREAR